MLTNIRPLSRVEILKKGEERVFQSRGLALFQPFALSQRKHFDLAQMQGDLSGWITLSANMLKLFVITMQEDINLAR